MPAIEELEQRVARLETLFEDVLKEKIAHISTRIDQLYEKTERDKTELLEKIANLYAKTEKDKAEILAKTERDKTELLEKIANLYAKTEKDKAEILAKTEKDKAEILAKTDKDKRELIYWMVGLMLGFSTLIITAIWAILSFALKQ